MKLFAFIAILVLVVALSRMLAPTFITVNKVNCSSQFGNCKPELSDSIESLKGNTLRSLNKELNDEFFLKHGVGDYNTEFKLPSTVNISVVEAKPEVALYKNGVYDLYTSSGEFLTTEATTQLPVVTLNGELPPDDLKFVVELFHELFKSYGVREASATSEGLTMQFSQEYVFILPTSGDVDVVLGSIQLVSSGLNSLELESRIEEVDFRFKNPVIRSNGKR